MKIKSMKTSNLFIGVFAILFLMTAAQSVQVFGQEPTATPTPGLSPAQVEKIEAFVGKQMTVGKIPGMSVVIVMGDQTVYEKGFGFADLEKKTPVTPTTLFELGSTSKAFTGLGLLRMEKEGLLKLSDPVEKFLPWLKLKYKGKELPVTIGQFLHQTGGVPFESIATIPDAGGNDALEKTVRNLVGMELHHQPGSKFLYATINYDVLGLIIQQISGEPYEEYMKKKVLLPLGLTETYLFREEAEAKGMAVGYKRSFNKPVAYDAPVYRGNTPAGYFITNARDLARWLKIQMGTIETGDFDKTLIETSHISDPDLPDSNYAAGWMIFKNYQFITHGGNNPNFSSYIGFGNEKVGVAVQSNIDSNFTTGTGQGIFFILRGTDPKPTLAAYDMNMRFDDLSAKIVYVLIIFLIVALILFIRSLAKIAAGKKRFSLRGIVGIVVFIAASGVMAAWIYLISIIPTFLGFNVPVSFGFVWMPCTFTYAIFGLFLLGFLYYLFFLSVFFFRKAKP
ncbi:MAG: serine hydrolase [Candidatus Aminicenantes bacterium]|nr:serine hydrolase [Candidatus Aminicenantes bacterium]